VSACAVALLDQRLGFRDVGGILDPEFEVTRAIVADAPNVPAEPLFELVADELLRRPSDR